MERAVAILPADDFSEAKAFYVDRLGFRLQWETTSDGVRGLFGVERGGMALTIDAPMSGHGRQACVSLHVDDADAYYDEWRQTVSAITEPRDEPWGARTFGVTDPAGNTIFVIGPPRGQSPEPAAEAAPPRPRTADGLALQERFGQIDIYLFDQLLRGRIAPGMRILDAGCGGGRNLVYLLREGFDVSATDASPDAISQVKGLAASLAPTLPGSHFRVQSVENCSFADASFDVVISSAVLHFARDDRHFDAMVGAMWRVLKPGGLLFCRLASTIGLSGATPLGDNRYLLPDGSERYLVSAERLIAMTRQLGARLLDPLKTTVVQDQRSMTTWVLSK